MFLFEHKFDFAAENLACDEALLEIGEHSDSPGFLRFWESPSYFVVLGFSRRLAREVYEENCADLQIPIARRISGGGTVLQGPGCLNYSLVLPITIAAELETITGANRLIMERIRDTIALLSKTPIAIQGHTDLTLDGRKFSGNAQRRKKNAILFHGSFLLNFDLSLISKTLRIPAEQPEYRKERTHADFLTNLAVPAPSLLQALAQDWQAQDPPSPEIIEKALTVTRQLTDNKYTAENWTHRF